MEIAFIWAHVEIQEPLRLRYKVTYQQFGVDMELVGDYSA